MTHGARQPLLPDPTQPRDTAWPGVWVVIIFLVLLVILYPTAWKNVLAGLKTREERIRKDIADAEAARDSRPRRRSKEYNTQLATPRRRSATCSPRRPADGEQLATNIRMQAQQEAEEVKERATRDIEAARKNAASPRSTRRPPSWRPASRRRSCGGT